MMLHQLTEGSILHSSSSVQDRWGHTPLQDAIAEKHFAIIDVLHGLKAKLLYKDPAGMLCQVRSRERDESEELCCGSWLHPKARFSLAPLTALFAGGEREQRGRFEDVAAERHRSGYWRLRCTHCTSPGSCRGLPTRGGCAD